jgi:hypothetical protein
MSNESISFISGQDKAIRDIFCFAYTLGLLELPIYICGEVSKKDCHKFFVMSTEFDKNISD